jgi:hypothetical protein
LGFLYYGQLHYFYSPQLNPLNIEGYVKFPHINHDKYKIFVKDN